MRTGIKTILWLAWIIIFALGCLGLVERVMHGHQSAAYGSYVVWGLWVSQYIYFIGLSAGSFLLSSLIYAFGLKRLEPVGRLALFVALVTLSMALLSIWFDLGRMERPYRVFTSPNFGSMMAWMVWLYTAYTILLALELWAAMRPHLAQWSGRRGYRGTVGRLLAFNKGQLSEDQATRTKHWLGVLALVGIPLAVLFHGGVGSLFGTLSAHSYWHTPLMPILFLTGALVSGGGLMVALVAMLWPATDRSRSQILRQLVPVVAGLLGLDVILEWAEYSIPMWYGVGREYELLMQILFGEQWWLFWIVHVCLGTLLPFYLFIVRPKAAKVGIAGALIATTFLAVRFNLVVPAQTDPNLRGLQTAFIHPRLVFEYTPSFFEWQIFLFVVAFGIALFYLGLRYLPLLGSELEA